ncbi:MAG TPA: divergent polysaccharide deacetylase family protein, partial [Thermoanaerobaculia bacterium]|nr:divergent polysaccharide deacetylase family protein [Thermoanaerobaculia bacterium]
MKPSRARVSPATLFFALLSLILGIALYLRIHPSPTEPARPPATASPHPRTHPFPRPRVSTPRPTRSFSAGGGPAIPRVAIVIDDLGNDDAAAGRIAAWPYPVAGAVLPGLPGSARTARRLEEAGKQVLLHLPMEP